MAGTNIDIDISGLTKLNKSFMSLQNKLKDRKSLALAIAATLRSGTQDRFETKTTPEGKSWTSSLVKRGDLRSKLIIEGTDDKAIVGSNLVYAAIHQFGGIIKPKEAKVLAFSIGGAKIFAKQVKIKANPYLGISKEDEENILKTIDDFMDEGLTA